MAASGARDAIIVGAGVFGLALADALLRWGVAVTVLDDGEPAASDTPVGALVPLLAAPPGDALAGLQAEGLCSLPALVARIEGETGVATGYRVIGRITPLGAEAARSRAEGALPEAEQRYQRIAAAQVAAGYAKTEARCVGIEAPWGPPLATEAAPAGVLWDRVSARVSASALREALTRRVDADPNGRVLRGWPVMRPLPAARYGGRAAVIGPRGRIAADAVILAAGWRSAALLDGANPWVRAEKGQAALLAAALPLNGPLIQAPGIFVVPHPATDGRSASVAIGSTREAGKTDLATDEALDGVLKRAAALVPALRDAPILALWAGVRPRPARRLPVVGPIPEKPGLWVASGGGGIGIALAPVVAKGLATEIMGGQRTLPAECIPSAADRSEVPAP
ncbi:MAG: FAD-dependent oxidoreductase [Pseudomonadota bacterium]